MFLLLPIGHDQEVRRFPWLTAVIMMVSLAVQLHRTINAPSELELEELYVARLQLEVQALAAHDRLERGASGSWSEDERTFLAEFRAGAITSSDDYQVRKLLDADAALEAAMSKDLAFTLQFRPADGPSLRVLLYAFAHGGWMHLIGNLIFLWLVGMNLEDRWGRGVFLGVYLAGAAAAAWAYAIWHPGTPVALIGASGAIAAAMGAFLVCYAATRIRLWYFFWFIWITPRTGTFEVRAVVALPFWFAEQLLMSWLEAKVQLGVAYSAHVGGFAFGAALAYALKRTGVEEKHLLPRASRGLEWEEDPKFVAALDHLAKKEVAQAMPLLRDVVSRRPDHVAARRELCRAAVAAEDATTARLQASRVLVEAGREAAWRDVIELYRALEKDLPELVLDDRALAAVARSAIECSDPWLAIRVTSRLMSAFPESPVVPGAMWDAAQLQEDAGRPDLARKTLTTLVERYPLDPRADEARRKLARAV